MHQPRSAPAGGAAGGLTDPGEGASVEADEGVAATLAPGATDGGAAGDGPPTSVATSGVEAGTPPADPIAMSGGGATASLANGMEGASAGALGASTAVGGATSPATGPPSPAALGTAALGAAALAAAELGMTGVAGATPTSLAGPGAGLASGVEKPPAPPPPHLPLRPLQPTQPQRQAPSRRARVTPVMTVIGPSYTAWFVLSSRLRGAPQTPGSLASAAGASNGAVHRGLAPWRVGHCAAGYASARPRTFATG